MRPIVLLIPLLLLVSVIPIVSANATSNWVKVWYSTSDNTIPSITVNTLTANGTYDFLLSNYIWVSNGVNLILGSGVGITNYTTNIPLNGIMTIHIILITHLPITYDYSALLVKHGSVWLENGGWGLFISNDRHFQLQYGTNATNMYLMSSVTVTNDTAYDVWAGFNNTYAFIYVNGTYDYTTNTGVITSSVSDYICLNEWSTGGGLIGGGIYNLVEIYYSSESPYSAHSLSNLISKWIFIENQNMTAFGYNNYSTLTDNQGACGIACYKFISQIEGSKNSSIILTDSLPYNNGTDEYTTPTNIYEDDVSILTVPFTHYVYINLSSKNGVLNDTSGWKLAGLTYNLLFLPFIGYQFSNFTFTGGGFAGLYNPLSFFINHSESVIGYGILVAQAINSIILIPVSYIMIALWMFLIFVPKVWYYKALGSIFGIIIALSMFIGEQWLMIQNTTFTLQTFNTGFGYIISMIMIGINIIIWLDIIYPSDESGKRSRRTLW